MVMGRGEGKGDMVVWYEKNAFFAFLLRRFVEGWEHEQMDE